MFVGFLALLVIMLLLRVADDSRLGMTGLFGGIGGGAARPLLLFTGFATCCGQLF